MANKKFSIISLIVIVVMSSVLIQLRLDQKYTLSWDVFGYYLYLPSTFIYHDVGIEDKAWIDQIVDTYEPSSTLYQLHYQGETNRYTNQYTMGMAMLYLPFFLLAHLTAHLTGAEADGFSTLYEYFLNFGMLFYFTLGIWWLIQLGRKYFSDALVAITLLLLYFGTNLLQMATEAILSPHIALFAMYSGLLWFSYRYHQKRKTSLALVLGILLGLIILNRPTEIVALFIPLLWGIHKRGFKEQLTYLLERKKDGIFIFLIMLAIGSFQFAYWKFTSGHFIHNSYENPGEGLDLLTPHTLKFLFSFRKGWFIYTPLAFFMVYGLFKLRKTIPELFKSSLLVFFIGLYLMSSWTTWYYAGGSFSSRTLVNIYPIFFLPLATTLQFINKQRLKFVWFGVIGLLTVLNLFQTWQWKNGLIAPSRMTAAFYFDVFLQTKFQPEWDKDLLVYRSPETHQQLSRPEDYHSVEKYITLYDTNVVAPEVAQKISVDGYVQMDSTYSFTTAWRKPYEELTKKDHAWLMIDGKVFIPENLEEPPMLVVQMDRDGGAYKYRAYIPADWKDHLNEWVDYHYEYLTPEVRSTKDELMIYYWYRGKSPAYVEGFTVNVLERKDD